MLNKIILMGRLTAIRSCGAPTPAGRWRRSPGGGPGFQGTGRGEGHGLCGLLRLGADRRLLSASILPRAGWPWWKGGWKAGSGWTGTATTASAGALWPTASTSAIPKTPPPGRRRTGGEGAGVYGGG